MEFNFLKELGALPEKVVVISPFILAVVAMVKANGVSGVWLTRVSTILGVVFGILAQMATSFPVGFAGWVYAAAFGLFCGVVSSGAYKLGDRWLGNKVKEK